jgi:LysR family transcriptional regulator of gallate degradation
MWPNLRHLRCYQEIARLGSLSAASRAVHMSQPAVTLAAAGLESHFGTRLLLRRSSGISLTPAGEICLLRIEPALSQLSEALLEIGRNTGGERADLTRFVRSRQLDAMCAVVEFGNFSVAAREKSLSQSSIHRSARELETALGIALFEKTSFGVSPTREGARLARRVRLAFHELTQAKAEIEALEGAGSGRTVIGALPLVRSHLLPAALLEFSLENRQHAVEIVEGTYPNLLAGLRSADIDIVMGALRDPVPAPDVVQEHLFDDPLSIVARAGHPLTRHRRPTIKALRRYQWIAPRRGSPLRAHYDALFAGHGVAPPDASIECNSMGAARAFLLESDRLMLLSAQQVHYELRAALLTTLPHPDGQVTRPIGLTLRKNWRPTVVQAQLLEIVRRVAQAASA